MQRPMFLVLESSNPPLSQKKKEYPTPLRTLKSITKWKPKTLTKTLNLIRSPAFYAPSLLLSPTPKEVELGAEGEAAARVRSVTGRGRIRLQNHNDISQGRRDLGQDLVSCTQSRTRRTGRGRDEDETAPSWTVRR